MTIPNTHENPIRTSPRNNEGHQPHRRSNWNWSGKPIPSHSGNTHPASQAPTVTAPTRNTHGASLAIHSVHDTEPGGPVRQFRAARSPAIVVAIHGGPSNPSSHLDSGLVECSRIHGPQSVAPNTPKQTQAPRSR